MFKVTKEFKFEMAHKLSRSYTCKCQHIHGHSYRAKVTIVSLMVNDEDVVVDFTKVKEMFEALIGIFDHNFIVHSQDPAINLFIQGAEDGKYPLIIAPANPTAEYIASVLCMHGKIGLDKLVKKEELFSYSSITVEVFETATSSACFTLRKGENVSIDFHPAQIRIIDKTKENV